MKAFYRTIATALFAVVMAPLAALAAQPTPWQMTFQPAATDVMEAIAWFDRYTLIFIVPITFFVLGLLAYVVVRYSKKNNPVPSRTSHNTMIEVVWTVAPIVILLFIAVPSFQLLTKQYTPPSEPEMTIKTTGYQWYWGYEYQNDGEAEGEDLAFDQILLRDSDRADMGKESMADYPRLLAVDNEMVVPVDTTVRLLVTAADVLHSWTIPAFGVKMDAVPGRLNETWFRANKTGLFYGQCSELCGKDHAFMPIAVRVVTQEQYDAWYVAAKTNLNDANSALMASIEAANQVASNNE